MNILFLNSLGKSKWGGGEKWMVNAGIGLAGRGHRVTIACLPGSIIHQKSMEAGLGIFNFSIPADIAFWKVFTLKKFLQKNNIDVLVCCQNRDVKIGARAARKVGVKAIYSRQGIQNLSNKRKYIRPFTQYIDGIITNTKSIKEIYESFGWFSDGFIHVVYNGVEIDREIEPIDLHEKYKLPHGFQVVFSAGRLDHQKGFDLLVEVARKAKDQGLKWQIVIAGEGKLKDELNAKASEKGVSDRIHLIGFTNQVAAHIRGADIFVLPSRYEGMPNALLEAMAMGKASVATSVNGAPELVEEGVSGFLVASENVDQLFTKINELLTNESLRKSMENRAFLRVKDHFTIDNMIDNLEALFLQQLEKSDKS